MRENVWWKANYTHYTCYFRYFRYFRYLVYLELVTHSYRRFLDFCWYFRYNFWLFEVISVLCVGKLSMCILNQFYVGCVEFAPNYVQCRDTKIAVILIDLRNNLLQLIEIFQIGFRFFGFHKLYLCGKFAINMWVKLNHFGFVKICGIEFS